MLSGIDYYEVSVVDISDPRSSASPFFIEAVSPYKIPFESSNKCVVLVNAYDKAGNYVQSKETLRIIAPFLFFIDRGIIIKGLFLKRWLIYGFLIIVTGAIGFFVYRTLRKRNLRKTLRREVAEAEKEIEDVRKLERKIREMRTLEEDTKREEERLTDRLRGRE